MTLSTILIVSLLCLGSYARVLPFQSHSFNELDYALQQLVKGVDSFKFDVNAAGQESCSQYSSWKGHIWNCEYNHDKHMQCCLSLRGDGSSGNKLNDYFNTTDEFIAVLNNPKYDFVWHKEKRLAQYNYPIYIAMNVQYRHVQGKMTKKWLVGMIDAIQNRNLDIKLMTASHWIIDHFGDLCKKRSRDCDADAKKILAFHWIYQGDDENPESDFGHYENLNIEFPGVENYCSQGFPQYAETTPYYFYEIAHEADVQWIANTYLSENCKRPESRPDISSARITSNVDLEMFQSYFNQKNPFLGIKNTVNTFVETFKVDEQILLSYYDTTQKATIVQLRSLSDTDVLPIISQAQLSTGPYTRMSYKAPYLLLSSSEVDHIFKVQYDQSLALETQFSISKTLLASDFVTYNNEIYFAQVEKQGQCQAGSLSFTITNLNTQQVRISQCTNKITAFDTERIHSANLAVSLDANQNLQGILFVSAHYTTMGQEKNALYAFTFATGLSNLNFLGTMTIATPSSFFDFGVDPSVKIINNNGQLFVLEGHSNSLVQCGHGINTGNIFKCGIPNTKNPHNAWLQSVKYSMSYNWGKLEDFFARIQSGRYVSACDSKIMHGRFYNGERPNGIVFRERSSGALQALFVNQYVDYKKLPIGTKFIYGATNNLDKIEDKSSFERTTFDILDYELFKYL